VLAQRLAPLESLPLPVPDLVAKYSQSPNMNMAIIIQSPFETLNRLGNSVRQKILNGTAEERTAALDALDPEVRTKLLGTLPDNLAKCTPKRKNEIENAPKAVQEDARAHSPTCFPQTSVFLKCEYFAAVTPPGASAADTERVIAAVRNLDPEKR